MSKATPAQITEAIDRFFKFYPGTDYVSQIDKDNYRRRETGYSESDFDTYPESERAGLLSQVLDTVFAAEDAARRAGVEAYFADEGNVPDADDLNRDLIATVANEVEGLPDITADAYGEFHSNLPVWATDDHNIEDLIDEAIVSEFEGEDDLTQALLGIDQGGGDQPYFSEEGDGGFDLEATVDAIREALQEQFEAEVADDPDRSADEIVAAVTAQNGAYFFDLWVEA
ncbi:MAG: hypothetical protein R2732_10340 [Microbacteriaceae bacterium]